MFTGVNPVSCRSMFNILFDSDTYTKENHHVIQVRCRVKEKINLILPIDPNFQYMKKVCLSLFISVQPAVMFALLNREFLAADGLRFRMFFCTAGAELLSPEDHTPSQHPKYEDFEPCLEMAHFKVSTGHLDGRRYRFDKTASSKLIAYHKQKKYGYCFTPAVPLVALSESNILKRRVNLIFFHQSAIPFFRTF